MTWLGFISLTASCAAFPSSRESRASHLLSASSHCMASRSCGFCSILIYDYISYSRTETRSVSLRTLCNLPAIVLAVLSDLSVWVLLSPFIHLPWGPAKNLRTCYRTIFGTEQRSQARGLELVSDLVARCTSGRCSGFWVNETMFLPTTRQAALTSSSGILISATASRGSIVVGTAVRVIFELRLRRTDYHTHRGRQTRSR